MGAEFGQWREWSEQRSLTGTPVEQFDTHRKLQAWVRDPNHAYRQQPRSTSAISTRRASAGSR